ncbi:MAG: alpha/beta hydrolase [Chloroflexota bacterium]
MIQHNQGTFKGADGLDLFYQSWLPESGADATLVIVHGLGEHSGRYQNVVNHFVPQGYAIYSFDHRGHGRSPGQQGYVNSFDEFVADLGAFVQMVSQRETGKPFFLLGHSMGGCITLNYVIRHPEGLDGVIASAPAVGALDIPPILLLLSRAMEKLAPKMSVATGLDATAVSRNPDVVAAYQNDPLVHGKGSPRFAMEFKRSAEWAQANAGRIQLPFLMVHGSHDRLVNVENSRTFFASLTQSDKKLLVYEGGFHELHNDIIYEQELADIEAWLMEHR